MSSIVTSRMLMRVRHQQHNLTSVFKPSGGGEAQAHGLTWSISMCHHRSSGAMQGCRGIKLMIVQVVCHQDNRARAHHIVEAVVHEVGIVLAACRLIKLAEDTHRHSQGNIAHLQTMLAS